MPTHPDLSTDENQTCSTAPSWVEKEFKTLELGDVRRERRLKQMADDFYTQPGASIPRASGEWAGTKAAYRLLDNEACDPAAVLAAHREAALQRAKGVPVVLAVEDMTTLNFTTHEHTKGLGPISNRAHKPTGLLLHTTLLLRENGEALGVVDMLVMARDAAQFKAGANGLRNRQPSADKESRKWLHSVSASVEAAGALKGSLVINIADREADSYELFLHHQKLRTPDRAHELLIRAQHNRQLTHDHDRLFTHLQKQPVAAHWSVEVPRQPGKKARVATLAIRFAQVQFAPPAHQAKYQGYHETLTLWVICAQEENPPSDCAAICWRLLSTSPVEDAATAINQVRRYSQRWQIELFHKILKSGCKVEERQFENTLRIERCLVLDVIVAARILALSRAGREPGDDQPASLWLAEHEWKALWCQVHRSSKPPSHPPSIRQAVIWIAKLGGFLARKGDGHPGMIALWRGLQRLNDITLAYKILTQHNQDTTCG